MKSTSFPNYFSEKIILIGKIPKFLQEFKVVISAATTEQKRDLGRASSDIIRWTGWKHSRDVLQGFEHYENIFGESVLHILSKMDERTVSSSNTFQSSYD